MRLLPRARPERRTVLSLTACLVSLAAAAAARADITFTKIIDDSGTVGIYTNFGQGPTLNADGNVLFRADRLNSVVGYYRGNGGPISPVLENNTSIVNSFSPTPFLHDNGSLAFAGFPDGGGQAVFRLNGSTVTTIADSFGPLLAFSQAFPAADGTVAFFAVRDTLQEGVYKSDGSALITIADTLTGVFDGMGSIPSINNSGVVAFQAELGSFRGIYLGSGGALTPIAETGGQFGVFFGEAPMINNLDQVVFSAALDAGGLGLFRYDSGEITTVVDTAGDFQNFNNAFGFNDAGQIVFRATLDDGRRGLFFGPDPELHKIIVTGDPLFGSTLLELQFNRGLSSQGEVAFWYSLANGLTGIAKVSAIPEPAATGLFGGALGLLLLRRRR